jgi:hypothetical protein
LNLKGVNKDKGLDKELASKTGPGEVRALAWTGIDIQRPVEAHTTGRNKNTKTKGADSVLTQV